MLALSLIYCRISIFYGLLFTSQLTISESSLLSWLLTPLSKEISPKCDKELESLSNETQSTIYFITNLVDVWQELNSYSHGFIISASESDLDAHKETHEIFRMAPSTISTITLQHGFECVGFLMNDNHQKYYGSSVGFASDYICGWSPKELQRNLRKLQHTRYQILDLQRGLIRPINVISMQTLT